MMALMVRLVLFISLLVACHAVPSKRTDSLDMTSFGRLFQKTSLTQLRYTQQIEHRQDDGVITVLKYDVVHAAPTHSLYDMQYTHHECGAEWMSLHFENDLEKVDIQPGHIVAGVACDLQILRRVESVVVHGKVVKLVTVDLDFHEAFLHADVELHTGLQKASVEEFPTTGSDVAHHVRVRGVWSWISGVWSSFSDWLDNVGDTAHQIYASVKSFSSGNLEKSIGLKADAISWNWNGVNGAKTSIMMSQGTGYTLECHKCYANLNVQLTFRLKVVSYTLKQLELFATGTAHVGVGAKFTANSKRQWSKEIARIKLKDIIFAIGVVPIKISTTIPISLGAEMDPDQSAVSLTAWASAVGQVQLGMLYNPATRKIVPVHTESYSHDGGLSISRGKASAVLFVSPLIVFDVNYIGGPNVGLRPYVEAILESNSKACSHRGRATLNLGLSTSIGAEIKVKKILDPGLTFGPVGVSQMMREIVSGCLSSKRAAHDTSEEYLPSGLTPMAWLEGNVWNGVQHLNNHSFPCDSNYPHGVEFSMQLISLQEADSSNRSRAEFALAGTAIDDSSPLTVNQTHADVPALGSCVFQQMMNATIDWNAQTLEMDVDADDASITYSSCVYVHIPISPTWAKFSFAGTNGFQMKGDPTDNCVHTLLTQGVGNEELLIKI